VGVSNATEYARLLEYLRAGNLTLTEIPHEGGNCGQVPAEQPLHVVPLIRGSAPTPDTIMIPMQDTISPNDVLSVG
jgi:hypothetical protein